MSKPKMVIFDAGRTLLDYASIDTLKGVKAFMPYITSNPLHLTAEEIDQRTNEVFEWPCMKKWDFVLYPKNQMQLS